MPLPSFLPLPNLELQEEAVVVEGFRLLPLGGRSWFEFHPKALAGGGWDSNPLAVGSGADADAQARLAVGFEARMLGENGSQADVGGMLRMQRYADTPGRSFTGGEAGARVQFRGRRLQSTAEARWERTSEPVLQAPEQAERDSLLVGLGASHDGGASVRSVRLGWSSLAYREDLPYADRASLGHRRWTASGSWLFLGGADSLLGADAAVDSLDRPATAATTGYRAATLRGRWRHAYGQRTNLDVRLGAVLRVHDDVTAGDPGNDDDRLLAPVASLQLAGAWEERSWATLTASTSLVDGMAANASRREALEGTLRLRLLDRLELVGAGWVARRTDSAAPPGHRREIADDLYLRSGLEYRLRDGLGLRLWVSWQRHLSEAYTSYDRTLSVLELALAL